VLTEVATAPQTAPPRSLRVCVIGAGYVGLVSAACLAALGHDVTVVEIDRTRLETLRTGRIPIREGGLQPLVARGVAAGRLRFTDAGTNAGTGIELVMIAVGTPTHPDGGIDLSAIEAAVGAAVTACPEAVIVLKSTVPPGTCARMEALARALGANTARIAVNPEFLREGRAVRDFMVPDRIVIGARDAGAGELVAQLYAPLQATTMHCLPEEAELAKYTANSLLAARISFMNEISGIADAVGADVTRVATIVGADPRIGPAFLAAGLGWGGSCFPKDVRGLAGVGDDLGIATPMLDATIEANERQRQRALASVLQLLGGVAQPRVAVLGIAFKPHTDDVRESPARWLACALADAGIEVTATDPWALANAGFTDPRIRCAPTAIEAVDGADVTVLATEWPEYVALAWDAVGSQMRGNAVLDARNALDVHAVQAAGLRYSSLGRDVAADTKERVCAS
jgi:UDPglucose 6-dehydrogenase